MSMPRASGYFRTRYAQDTALLETRTQKAAALAFAAALAAYPFVAGPLALDLANQVLLGSIGAVALMLLTGYAGQISLGHAGLLAAGAFTGGVLFKELGAPFWVTLPAAALVGAGLGVAFGLPSLRLRGLYLAVSTLALHFIVIHAGAEYETRRGFSTGIVIDPPRIGEWVLRDARAWYFVLLAFAVANLLFSLNLLRARTGRAWRAVRGREAVAEALGISVRRAKLAAFVVSSAITAVAGCLFAYYRGFVSAEAFSLYLTIQYVAMIIIGGMGSLMGSYFGAAFIVMLPILLNRIPALLGVPISTATASHLEFMIFGVLIVLFLILEPHGLARLWSIGKEKLRLWPFPH